MTATDAEKRPAVDKTADHAVGADPESLVANHTILVKRIAHHLKARLPDSVQIDDLYQSGMIGLLEAARNYNPVQGASFETYAGIRIRGAMLDELRKSDWTPKSVYRKSRELANAIRAVESREGRDARDQEIADELGVSMEAYHKILTDNVSSVIFSLDVIGIDDSLSRQNSTRGGSTFDDIQKDYMAEGLSNAINSLPERERMVVTLYYDDELNLREIGEVIGVTESRCSQLLSQSIARLRARMQDWLDDK